MRTFELASRLGGAAWGHLVGDAVGVPYEFGPARPADTVVFGATGAHHQPPGTWSDDGALMLALLDSLLDTDDGRRPAFDLDDQGRRALAWQRDGAYTPDGDGLFDIGGATSEALRRLASGVPAVDAGPTGERACGNGSLMRILPVALVGRDLPPAQLITRAHLASRVTHGHPRCQVACAVYCVTVAGLLRGQAPDEALEEAFAANERLYLAEPGHEGHRAALAELRGWEPRSGSGFVVDAFWSAWDAFAGAADYPDTIRRAVAYGSDTDTTAAIAGGLAGAYWGWESIPLEWRRGMRGREVATPLVDALVATTGARTSTGRPLRVDEVDLRGSSLEGAGRVGITFLPGKKQDGVSGTHWRDLDLDLARLRELRVDALFLLVEDSELDDCLVPDLPEVMAAAGPELLRFPIPDPHIPADPAAFCTAIVDLADRVRAGRFIAIACRGGIDRSGMTAACLLHHAGLDADEAIRRIQAARQGSITLPEQQDFVRACPPARTDSQDPAVPEPLQRRTYQAAELVRRHPAVLRNENKQVLYAIACPAGTVHAGRLEYSRWPEIPLPLPREVDSVDAARLAVVRDGFFDYRPVLDSGVGVEWHVNFADPNLFYAYGSEFFAQDEIQVAEHPVLGSLREAIVADGQPTTTIENGRPTPVLVMGAERRISIQTAPGAESGGPSWLYGRAFAGATADAVHEATTRIDPPTVSNIIAMVAPYGGRGRYQREQIGLAIGTAYTGFRTAVLESRRTAGPDVLVAIHSGFWGCGAFGGNRVMMTLVQLLAADMAGVTRLVFHVGDPSGRASVERALALAPELATATSATDLIARAEALGLVWGVSDDN